MYEDILIPTDGSRGTKRAIEQGIDIAKKYGATVHALYVIDTSAENLLVAESSTHNLVNKLKEHGEDATNEIEKKSGDEGVEAVKEVLRGTPHRVILEYADENDIDLIVMGTHGRTGLNRFLLGSVTERVVRTSEIPVLTVRLKEEEVNDPENAVKLAVEALKEDYGHESVSVNTEPYRESNTWVVRAVAEDGTEYNVHLDATGSDLRVARIRER